MRNGQQQWSSIKTFCRKGSRVCNWASLCPIVRWPHPWGGYCLKHPFSRWLYQLHQLGVNSYGRLEKGYHLSPKGARGESVAQPDKLGVAFGSELCKWSVGPPWLWWCWWHIHPWPPQLLQLVLLLAFLGSPRQNLPLPLHSDMVADEQVPIPLCIRRLLRS